MSQPVRRLLQTVLGALTSLADRVLGTAGPAPRPTPLRVRVHDPRRR